MTEHDPLERYLDDFGARLALATPPPRPARHRRPIALATALTVAVGVGAAILLGGSPASLDPVAEARAALASPGEIVYMKITSEVFDTSPGHVPRPQTTEQWSAFDPPRWRFVQTISPQRASRGVVGDTHGVTFGREEISYAHGEQSMYVAAWDRLDVIRGFSDHGPEASAPSPLGTGSGDLQTDLRSMLAGGKVTDEGERQVNGRTVRRLVSEQRILPVDGDPSAGSRRVTDPVFVRRFVYDVDAQTFAPIDGTLTMTIQTGGHPSRVRTRMHVDAYRRIPLNDTTAKLLEIRTTPHTKVRIQTVGELQVRALRTGGPCRTSKNGDKVCQVRAR